MKRFAICLLIATFALSFSYVKAQVHCLTPDTGKTSNITANSAKVSWNVSSDSLYIIRYINIDNPGGPYQYKKTSNTNFVLTNLLPNTNYRYQIESYCTFRDKSDYSYPANFKTLAPTCKVPVGLIVTKISSHGATFSWSGNGSHYTLMYKALNDIVWKYKPTTNETLTLSNLLSNTTYQWQVKSFCSNPQVIVYSAISSFQTLAVQCNNPTVIIPTEITSNSITLLWDKSPDATSYKIKWWVIGKDSNSTTWIHYYPKTGQPPLTTNTFRLPSLIVDATYKVQIKAICGNDEITTDYSKVFKFTTKMSRCPSPANLTHSNLTATSVKLSWTTCPLAQGYVIQYYKKQGNQNDPLVHYRKVTTTPFILTGLQAGGFTWGWKVRTQYFYLDTLHSTLYSNEDVFATPAHRLMADGNINLPEMVVYPNPSNGNFNLSFNNNCKFDFAIYNIQGALVYSENNNPANTLKSINLTGFNKGIYFLRVLSNNEVKTTKLLIQ